MTVIAIALKHLIAAGVSGDDLVRAVAEMEAATDTRSTGAKRTARWRERHKASQSVTPVTCDDDPAPPNEYISNPPVNPDGAKAPCPPFSEIVVSAWNDGPGSRGATKATKLDAGRRKALGLRVRDHSEQAVLDAIANLAGSEFHCGKNDRGWKANIGWLLKSPENFMKALEMGPVASAVNDAKPMTDADRAAYLAKLEVKPWANATPRAEQAPRKGNTGPPRSIGQLAAGIAGTA